MIHDRRSIRSTILTGLFCVASVYSTMAQDEPAKPSVEEAFAKVAALGPGPQKIKKDSKGRIISALFVGQATISTVLGKAKGLELARNSADLAATSEFVKWLKGKARVYESVDQESVVLLEGTEGGDKESQTSSG